MDAALTLKQSYTVKVIVSFVGSYRFWVVLYPLFPVLYIKMIMMITSVSIILIIDKKFSLFKIYKYVDRLLTYLGDNDYLSDRQ